MKLSDSAGILKDLVRIPTYEKEADAVAYLAGRFDSLGIRYEISRITEGRENITAEWGEGSRSLVFNSHIDTVFPGNLEEWTRPPFGAETIDGRLYGRGASDAKGSLAAMVAAIEAVAVSGIALKGKLVLTAVAYEETRGLGTQYEVENGLKADAAVIGEPTSLDVCIAHKGVFRGGISVKGKSAHASEPWEGINAIYKMQSIIRSLNELADRLAENEDPLLGVPTLAVTRISGGIGNNVIPPECGISFDRRLVRRETPLEARKQIEEVLFRLGEEDPELDAVLVDVFHAEAASTDPGEEIVKAALNARADVLGESSEPRGFKACCDMRLLTNQGGIPAVILGPGPLELAHKTDEWVFLSEVEHAAKIYELLATRWLT